MSELNVGNVDRVLRILIGLLLVGLTIGGVIGPWGYVGVVVTVTGAVALCPIYRLLGIRSTSR